MGKLAPVTAATMPQSLGLKFPTAGGGGNGRRCGQALWQAGRRNGAAARLPVLRNDGDLSSTGHCGSSRIFMVAANPFNVRPQRGPMWMAPCSSRAARAVCSSPSLSCATRVVLSCRPGDMLLFGFCPAELSSTAPKAGLPHMVGSHELCPRDAPLAAASLPPPLPALPALAADCARHAPPPATLPAAASMPNRAPKLPATSSSKPCAIANSCPPTRG